MKNAQRLALSEDGNAKVSALYAHSMSAGRAGVAGGHQVRLSSSQRPACAGIEIFDRKYAIGPGTDHLGEAAGVIHHGDCTAHSRKDFGSIAECGGKSLIASHATLQ